MQFEKQGPGKALASGLQLSWPCDGEEHFVIGQWNGQTSFGHELTFDLALAWPEPLLHALRVLVEEVPVVVFRCMEEGIFDAIVEKAIHELFDCLGLRIPQRLEDMEYQPDIVASGRSVAALDLPNARLECPEQFRPVFGRDEPPESC